ncbi:MAG: diaminopimelate decarboxylase [Phycisphaeraceae bacterium]
MVRSIMDYFHYKNGQLYCEDVAIDDVVAETGTPAYVYSRRTFEHHYDAVVAAFAELDPLICYSIKSCGNVHILRMLAERGAGMDVVSGGELYRAQQAGVDMGKVVYAGVGKTDAEIRAALEAGIGWFNIESEQEFENVARLAGEMGVTAQGALRVNPDVDPATHAKTTTGKKETKFGVDIDRARRFFQSYGNDAHLKLNALHLHIGSPIYKIEPYAEAIRKALALIEDLRGQGYTIDAIDIGGGYGADYETDQTPRYAEYAARIVPLLRPFKQGGGRVILEPGRSIAANAGVLVTQVQYVKQGGSKTFVIVDSGMHHLIRPTLYEAFHFVWPTKVAPEQEPSRRTGRVHLPGLRTCDVVGPVCESGDYLAKGRELPAVQRGDNLAVFSAGAYGMVMASHYNALPNPPEVLVEGDRFTVIRRRETYEDLLALEQTPAVPARAPSPVGRGLG